MPATLEVFDPPLCCPTGACGPAPDPVFARFSADLAWLRSQGVEVVRRNLAQDPGAFATHPVARKALESVGLGSLPLVLLDGAVVAQGAYPSRDALAAALADTAARGAREVVVDLLALDLAACDRCAGSGGSLREAIAEAADALAGQGVRVKVRATVVETETQAEALRFEASPTIRVDGRDIAAERRESDCRCCGDLAGAPVDCRVWVFRGEEHAVAPKEMILEAVLAAARDPRPAAPPAGPFVVPENIRRFLAGRAARRASAASPASPCCAPLPRHLKPRVPKGRCC